MIEPKPESVFTGNNNPLCQNTVLWQSYDEQSAECEVSEFIGALVRLLKPRVVVETGCYHGDTTLAIAQALQVNDRGQLYACDIDPDCLARTRSRIEEYDQIVEAAAKIHGGEFNKLPASIVPQTGLELIENLKEIDFAFIDSGDADCRSRELNAAARRMKPFSVIALHDTAPQHMKMCQYAGAITLPGIYLNTPRGLSLFVKNY